MKNMPSYSWIAPCPGVPEAGLILQSKDPHCLGQIWKFHNVMGINDYVAKKNPLIYSQCGAYQVIITYYGRLDGNFIRVNGADWQKGLQKTVDGMSLWFLETKILKNMDYYKRFLP
jgi:hypothetical protein